MKLAKLGWNVALVARRESALNETVALAGEVAGQMLVCPCDIGDVDAVTKMAGRVIDRFGGVQALVNAAGTNVPRRSLKQLAIENYHKIMDANLNGAYYCAQAFLPIMRRQKSGTIVNINSLAGRRASELSGVAYVISKFGLAGLTQSINIEENSNGIRACSIFPGDINTPLLKKRPAVPSTQDRQEMLRPEDVAECILLAINLPPRAVIEELVVRPR